MSYSTAESPLVLVNGQGQYSLWAGHLEVPPGWRVALPQTSYEECVDFLDNNWLDIAPPDPDGATGVHDRRADDGFCVHALFAAQVERTPDEPALLWHDEEITYRELHKRSDELSRVLVNRGVSGGDRVGLCTDRSPQAVIALLGILKAGAAYVPLDPEYPVERLRYVLADTGARLLLTQEKLGHLFADYDGDLMFLGRESSDASLLPGGPDTGPEAGVLPSSPAYVIHTSGSTGEPKGVLVTHRSLAHHSAAVNETFRLGPGERVLQCRPLSFDAAAEEIFPPLLHGATLVLGDDPLRQTFRSLTQEVIDTRATFLSVPTAFWHSWVLEEDCLVRLASESSLRLMIVAGEKAQKRSLGTWRRRIGSRIRWCNVYGPTEGTITSTLFEPADGWDGGDCSSVPIGHPVGNVRVHVLDDVMRPVGAGAVGELYIGGDGVAAGYLHKPALTAERFLADPFSGRHGSRMYRTGDLVRTTADGSLEFIGRRDHQVKLRGHRIELGEIEAVLGDHPDVEGCVALLDEADPDEKKLVSFAVVRDGVGVSSGGLVAHLRRHLPWYMVPASVRTIEALPTTPNGKTDRAALLALEHSDASASGSGHIAPRTAAEAALAEIWEEVLGQKGISVDDDFFQIGGHSLLAATLLSRMRSRLRVSVPARVLFTSPTIEGLAAAIEQLGSESTARVS